MPLALRAAGVLPRGRLEADVIAALAVAGSLAPGEYLAGEIMVVMQTSGEVLAQIAFPGASDALTLLTARRPRTANRMAGGRIDEIAASGCCFARATWRRH